MMISKIMQIAFTNMRTNAFSSYAGWSKTFSDKVSAVQQELDELTCRMSSENNSHRIKKARTRYRESDEEEDSMVDSGESSSSDENSTNAYDHQEVVIENDNSSSGDDTNEFQNCGGSESGESNDGTSNVVNASDEHIETDKDDTHAESGSDKEEDDDDYEEDSLIEETEQFHKSAICQSKLYMAVQGFQLQTNNQSSDGGMNATADNRDNRAVFDPAVIEFEGKSFRKNKCYVLNEKDTVVGIQRFISTETALCVLVVDFKYTILGRAGADLMKDAYVQVFKCVKEISLSDLEEASDRVEQIPRLIYQAQTPGKWHSFGYFYQRTRAKTLRRREQIRSLEVFAGAGGSLQG